MPPSLPWDHRSPSSLPAVAAAPAAPPLRQPRPASIRTPCPGAAKPEAGLLIRRESKGNQESLS